MKKEKKDILRLPSIIIVLLLISFLTLFYIDKKINEVKKREINSNENRVMELSVRVISNDVKNVISDLHFLEGTYEFYLNNKIDFNNLEETWKLFSENSGKYDQLRFIDINGNEMIRINYLNKKGDICSKDELQNKKDRYYFYETEKLNKNQHYVSKLDLNIEHNKIEKPIKPVIRFSTKVYNNKNEYIGIIVLNYSAERLLNDLENIALNSKGKIYLLNSSGYWIYGGNENENWAFMYEDRKKINFKNNFSSVWNEMNAGKTIISSDNGQYMWRELELKDKYYENNNNQEDTFVLGDGNFRLVSFIDKKNGEGYVFLENIFEKIYRIVNINLFLFVLIILIAIMIETLIVITKKAYTKIKYTADHDGLTGVYNRRAGMERLDKLLLKDNRRKNNRFSICFVDVNGLKQVNDILGHEKGDELILTVANIIKKMLREEDLIIRFGGDEFVIVFLESDIEIAENVWKRITAVFNKINETENRKYILSVSHGIVESNLIQERIIENIIKIADEKMYEEKKKIKMEGFDVIK